MDITGFEDSKHTRVFVAIDNMGAVICGEDKAVESIPKQLPKHGLVPGIPFLRVLRPQMVQPGVSHPLLQKGCFIPCFELGQVAGEVATFFGERSFHLTRKTTNRARLSPPAISGLRRCFLLRVPWSLPDRCQHTPQCRWPIASRGTGRSHPGQSALGVAMFKSRTHWLPPTFACAAKRVEKTATLADALGEWKGKPKATEEHWEQLRCKTCMERRRLQEKGSPARGPRGV